MIQDTSIAAYNTLKQHKLPFMQAKVMQAIRELGHTCNEDISIHTGIPINSVCPRVKELRELGKVCNAGIALGPRGIMVHFWKAADFRENLFDND